MIDEIQVRNLALIRDATLAPTSGLTVLTGETGAGKTALLSAMKLLMGARASADLVRDGEDGLVVSGRFFGLKPEDDADADTDDADDADADAGADDETVVVRKVGADGRSRASINGSMASVSELGKLVAPSIDLCGQFEHQQLMRPTTHIGMLDAWAGEAIAPALESYRMAFAQATQAKAELDRVQDAQTASSGKLDEARFIAARIDEVHPEQGEYESLKHDLELAEHAEALVAAVAGAHAALSDDGGAIDALNVAASSLETMSTVDPDLAALAESLREAGYVLEDVSAQARDYRDKIEFDPQQLAFQQERYSQINGLLRAYGPRMEDVFSRREEAAELISLVDDSAERLETARQRFDQAEAELAKAADALDRAREEAAPRFTAEVTHVMDRLQMGGAQLACDQQRLGRESWTSNGPSSFEFLYRPAAGVRPRPLAKIASGGEVSRVMLAIKVVLGDHDDVETLVFDEVDTGVGGAVAVALAEVLSDLARTHQVIVVTHLAQVAVRGETHYVVQRMEDEGGAHTQLTCVEEVDREREIARMLSGSATETSLAHARELLESSK